MRCCWQRKLLMQILLSNLKFFLNSLIYKWLNSLKLLSIKQLWHFLLAGGSTSFLKVILYPLGDYAFRTPFQYFFRFLFDEKLKDDLKIVQPFHRFKKKNMGRIENIVIWNLLWLLLWLADIGETNQKQKDETVKQQNYFDIFIWLLEYQL